MPNMTHLVAGQMTIAACGRPLKANDQYCDDENNNSECNFDGGSCCNNNASKWNNFCIDCECLEDPVDQTTNPSLAVMRTFSTTATHPGKIEVLFHFTRCSGEDEI